MWNRELIQQLIAKYETFPELWDVSSPHYKNRFKKQSAVQSIGIYLNVPENEVKKKLHNLRTQLLQELRRINKKKSGQGAETHQESKWEFFDALKFIVAEKGTSNNTENLAQNLDGNENPVQTLEEIPSTNQEHRGKKRRCNETPTNTDDAKKAVSVLERSADEYQVFGDYIASEFRLLKSDRCKILLRRKIQRAILEVSEIDGFSESSSSPWGEVIYSSTSSPQAPQTEYHEN